MHASKAAVSYPSPCSRAKRKSTTGWQRGREPTWVTSSAIVGSPCRALNLETFTGSEAGSPCPLRVGDYGTRGGLWSAPSVCSMRVDAARQHGTGRPNVVVYFRLFLIIPARSGRQRRRCCGPGSGLLRRSLQGSGCGQGMGGGAGVAGVQHRRSAIPRKPPIAAQGHQNLVPLRRIGRVGDRATRQERDLETRGGRAGSRPRR